MQTPTRALVIGGSGFIGLHVVDALLERGWAVSVTRRKSTPTLFLRKRPVSLLDASLDDRGSLERAMAGCDVVALSAGYYPRYSTDRAAAVRTGVEGIENALSAAWSAGVRRVVYTSTVAVLGEPEAGRLADERDVNGPTRDDGVYASVKREMEKRVDAWRARGMSVVSMITGGCMGPGDLRLGTTGVLLTALRQILPFWVDGWVNLVDVRDVARAHVLAIDAPGPRYCLGGHDIRMRALLTRVAERYGVPLTAPEVLPEFAREQADLAEREAEPVRGRVPMPRELVDLVCAGQPVSSALAERELGLSWLPVDVSLDQTREWLVKYGYLKRTESHEQRA